MIESARKADRQAIKLTVISVGLTTILAFVDMLMRSTGAA